MKNNPSTSKVIYLSDVLDETIKKVKKTNQDKAEARTFVDSVTSLEDYRSSKPSPEDIARKNEIYSLRKTILDKTKSVVDVETKPSHKCSVINISTASDYTKERANNSNKEKWKNKTALAPITRLQSSGAFERREIEAGDLLIQDQPETFSQDTQEISEEFKDIRFVEDNSEEEM